MAGMVLVVLEMAWCPTWLALAVREAVQCLAFGLLNSVDIQAIAWNSLNNLFVCKNGDEQFGAELQIKRSVCRLKKMIWFAGKMTFPMKSSKSFGSISFMSLMVSPSNMHPCPQRAENKESFFCYITKEQISDDKQYRWGQLPPKKEGYKPGWLEGGAVSKQETGSEQPALARMPIHCLGLGGTDEDSFVFCFKLFICKLCTLTISTWLPTSNQTDKQTNWQNCTAV